MGKGLLLIYFLVFSILLTNTLVFGQEEKFGKIDESIFKMTAYEKDSSADALVLFDVGKTFYIYTEEGGFKIVNKRHRRIKIFNKNAYEYANIKIPYYTVYKNDNSESITKLKGATYKMGDGKVVKYELKNDDVFDETLNENVRLKKFTLPQISEGVIIEYEYEITSDFTQNFRGWDFQGLIPCLWSEYTSEIPEYYNYRANIQGYLPFDVRETSIKLTQITINSKSRSISSFGYSNYAKITNEIVSFSTNVATYLMKNVPAFKKESYITAPYDYISSIEFQLISYKFPNGVETDVSTTWEKIGEILMEFESFGEQLKKREFIKGLLNTVNTSESAEEKSMYIYDFVKDNIKWNEEIGIFPKYGINKAFESKSGNVADINLLLTAMLKGAGFEAYPVLLSTRNNGRNLFFPTLSKFNYLLVLLKLDGKSILLDASSQSLPFGMLNSQCLNGKGLVVKENGIEWVDLQYPVKAFRSTIVALNMGLGGKITGEIQMVDKEYAALKNRDFILYEGEEKFVEENWKNSDIPFNIQSYVFENLRENYKPLNTTLKINIEQESAGDRIYFNPVLVKKINENPFNPEERKYPVDFDYPIIENYFLTLTIPPGYEVEELPKNISCTLLDNSGKYTYIFGKKDNILQLRVSLSINKFTFLPEEYKALKEFFTQFIAKQSEQIVLKKIK